MLVLLCGGEGSRGVYYYSLLKNKKIILPNDALLVINSLLNPEPPPIEILIN